MLIPTPWSRKGQPCTENVVHFWRVRWTTHHTIPVDELFLPSRGIYLDRGATIGNVLVYHFNGERLHVAGIGRRSISGEVQCSSMDVVAGILFVIRSEAFHTLLGLLSDYQCESINRDKYTTCPPSVLSIAGTHLQCLTGVTEAHSKYRSK